VVAIDHDGQLVDGVHRVRLCRLLAQDSELPHRVIVLLNTGMIFVFWARTSRSLTLACRRVSAVLVDVFRGVLALSEVKLTLNIALAPRLNLPEFSVSPFGVLYPLSTTPGTL